MGPSVAIPYQNHRLMLGTWQRVMNTALLRMVREIASDPALLTVLRERGLTKAAAREP